MRIRAGYLLTDRAAFSGLLSISNKFNCFRKRSHNRYLIVSFVTKVVTKVCVLPINVERDLSYSTEECESVRSAIFSASPIDIICLNYIMQNQFNQYII